MTMRISSHKKWPWSTWHIPERNLVSKPISFVMHQRRVTIETMSNPRNNKQPWSTLHEIKEKIDFKIKKPMVCIKGYHSEWPCLPLTTISDLEALDTFQRDIWFQNLNPLSYIKSNEWPINWGFYLIINSKAKQISQYHANDLDPANLNFTAWNWSQAFHFISFHETSNQNVTFAKPFSR